MATVSALSGFCSSALIDSTAPASNNNGKFEMHMQLSIPPATTPTASSVQLKCRPLFVDELVTCHSRKGFSLRQQTWTQQSAVSVRVSWTSPDRDKEWCPGGAAQEPKSAAVNHCELRGELAVDLIALKLRDN